MGYRRSAEEVAASRVWREFVARHSALADAAGLPAAALESRGEWDEFLMHGFLRGDPGGFRVEQLSAPQYAALVELAGAYFAAYFSDGRGLYTPIGLRPADAAALLARFGGPGGVAAGGDPDRAT